MDPWQPRPTTPRRENQIQGPRPTPLRVSKDSVKIKKPPKAPQPPLPPPAVAAAPPPPGNQPVIIYSVSPKPYYVAASDFRSLVQQLTGRETLSPAPAPETSTSGGFFGEPPVSPAARLAALERTSPKERDWRRGGGGGGAGEVDYSMTVEGEEEIEVMSQMPGILSPAPANLPAISPGMFTTAVAGDGIGFFGMNELMSPFMSNITFLPSPSALFFSNAPIVSPSPSGEFFNIFDF